MEVFMTKETREKIDQRSGYKNKSSKRVKSKRACNKVKKKDKIAKRIEMYNDVLHLPNF